MVQWLQDHNVPYHLLSEVEGMKKRRQFSVILVDRIGVLFDLYALGDLIFCGGTLEPIGGHNILEPAAWGKPIFYGPHMEKVREEHNTLEAHKGAFLVRDSHELIQQWSYWIQHLSQLKSHGRGAREALRKQGGVAAKQVELIMKTLSYKKDGTVIR
jgi:3-deoxy-D-manno-octulosonic-acid transferase